MVKAIALGADACYVATAALLALGCHLCRTCQSGKCNWGIATQRPELVKRLNPEMGSERLMNLMTAWKHEIKELMGGMGINSIEALRGNRLMLEASANSMGIPTLSRILVGAAPVPPRKPSMAMISAPLRAIPLAMAAIL